MDKLYFLTAGVPLRAGTKGYKKGFEIHDEMGLDGLELEFVHGVRISDKSRDDVANAVKNEGKIITAHAPFYVNLNAREDDKVEASVQRIIETAQVANELGGYSITFHAGFYLNQDAEMVYDKIKAQTKIITDELNKVGNKIWIRPETTGKATQWGDLEEIIKFLKDPNSQVMALKILLLFMLALIFNLFLIISLLFNSSTIFSSSYKQTFSKSKPSYAFLKASVSYFILNDFISYICMFFYYCESLIIF